jgi:site-specific DNA-methyltransferase (adenine-specific)
MIDALFLTGDTREQMRRLPDGVVQTCVTSPPYFGLRDYGMSGQIGLEATPAAYVATMVEVFREVRRVLRDDGTLWLNLGDSYGKGKSLLGVPWRVAFALQADGWYLRQDIIWHKPNPMPESVRDRCTRAHEYLFLLAKSERYYFDADAVKEPAVNTRKPGRKITDTRETYGVGGGNAGLNGLMARYHDGEMPTHRNRRSVWTVTTKSFQGAHFATFPPDLIEPCILAGSKPGGVVLDPFGGAGTTALVARRHKRVSVYIELNPAYADLARRRVGVDDD